MREIKFRVWDGKIMIPFRLNDIENGYLDYERVEGEPRILCVDCEDEVDHCVTQYIGLQDKKGVEIFEGDILGWDKLDHPMVVEWGAEDGGWNLMWRYGKSLSGACANESYVDNFEVIGNIHQNPELLND